MRIKNKILLVFIGMCFFILNVNSQKDLYNRGKSELLKGSYSQAVKTFSLMTSENPEDVSAWLGKGEGYFGLKKYDLALKDFYKAQSIESNVSSFWIAKCYAMKSDPVNSMKALENHMRSPYKLPEKEIVMEPAFQKIERSREWRSFWKNDWYKPYDKQKADAVYQLKKENYNKAIEELNILLNQNEDDASLYFLRSQAYKSIGEENKSLIDLNLAVKKEPENAMFRTERARLYKTLDRQEEAVKDYTELIDKHPDEFKAYINRASVLLEMKKYDRALSDVNFYLQYFENSHEAQYFAGEICYEAGKYHDAVKYLNKALILSQGHEEYFIVRGNIYSKMNTLEQAVDDYSMALDLNPNNPEIYFNRGIARLRSDDTSNACYDFKKAFKMGKKEALEYLQRYCNY